MRLPSVSPVLSASGDLEQELSSPSVSLKHFSFRRTASFVLAAIRFSRGLQKYRIRHRRSRQKMGNTLRVPITDKASACLANGQLMVGSSCMQGWRNTMEDSHVHILDYTMTGNGEVESSFFAVFDGHFNEHVAEYCGQNLHLRLKETEEYRAGKIEEALQKSCLSLDAEILANSQKFRRSGSTGIIVVQHRDTLYCANVGDSRAIASVAGRAKPLSFDHKPYSPNEERRIVAAGGFVHMNRVDGLLAVARGFGDSQFKENENLPAEEQVVTANPEILVEPLSGDHEFYILACDGIWDCMSNQEVVDFVRERVASKKLPDQIVEELMMNCVAPELRRDGVGCDNMTVVLVILLHGEQYSYTVHQCQRPCSPSVHAGDEQPEAAEGEGEGEKSKAVRKEDGGADEAMDDTSAEGQLPQPVAESADPAASVGEDGGKTEVDGPPLIGGQTEEEDAATAMDVASDT